LNRFRLPQGQRSFLPSFSVSSLSPWTILMAFTGTDKAVDLKIAASKNKATLITRNNQRREVEAHDGHYAVQLPGATNFGGWPSYKDNRAATALGQPEHLVGGATIVIIEQ
jgi:hypothetical protein